MSVFSMDNQQSIVLSVIRSMGLERDVIYEQA